MFACVNVCLNNPTSISSNATYLGLLMSLSNYSQVLLRNVDLLAAKSPLLVNLPVDNFIDEYQSLHPNIAISCFNTHFGEYTSLKSRYGSKISTVFSACYQTEEKHDLVIIAFPKSKAELPFTLAMISPYLSQDAQILFIGEKNGGIKTVTKLSAEYVENCHKLDSARHCMLYGAVANNQNNAFDLNDWYQEYRINRNDTEIRIAALPGVFSQEGLDKGTAVLLDNLPEISQGKLLDFGCGAGVIAAFIGKTAPEVSLNLADVSALALSSAKQTLTLNNLTGNVFASDSLSHIEGKYQHIVSNPPFHQGVKTHYTATESFLQGIKQHTANNGVITIVANSFLRYQPIMEQSIGKPTIITQKNGFTIYQCKKR